MTTKVSIIVPVYNVAKYLEQCLDSIVNQTYKNIEIICVNDGSTDESLNILNSYAEKDSRIKIVTKENGGTSSAKNYGHQFVTGDYLMYVDADDWIDLDTCQVALNKALDTNADVVFWNYTREFTNYSKDKKIFGDDEIVFGSEDELNKLHRRFIGLYNEELSRPDNADSIVTVWGKLYKSDIILNNKLMFIDLHKIGTSEDALFNLYAFGFVSKAVYIPNCFNHYRKDNLTSLTKTYNNKLKGQWDNLFQYMREYVEQNNCDKSFNVALNNRICLGIIGLGMNIIRSDSSVKKVKAVKEVIGSKNYRDACKTLTLKYFPIHWKVFFLFAKCNWAFGVYMMLLCIRKLKGS